MKTKNVRSKVLISLLAITALFIAPESRAAGADSVPAIYLKGPVDHVEQAFPGKSHRAVSDIVEQGLHDFKRGMLNSWPYKAVNFIFGFDGLDKGSQEVFDVLAEYYVSGGRLAYLPPFGFVPMGGDMRILKDARLASGASRLGLFTVGMIPATKVVSTPLRGLRLMWMKGQAKVLAGGSKILKYAERKVLAQRLAVIGEDELARTVLVRSKIPAIEQAILSKADRYFQTTVNWGATSAIVKVVGLSMPSRPSSLKPVDLAKFAMTQGCLILSDSDSNITTKAIKLTGQKAWEFLTHIVMDIRARASTSPVSTLQALGDQYKTDNSCQSQRLDPAQISRMGEDAVKEQIQVFVNQATGDYKISRL